MSGLKLFHTTDSGVTEVAPRLAEVEADVQGLVEAHMEAMLGVRFLASEYVIDCADGGRIDSLGLDENGAPVVVEYKRGTDAGVINQGLYYMSWLMAHKDAFRNLVRDRRGASAASQVLWSAPRLICVAGEAAGLVRADGKPRYTPHGLRHFFASTALANGIPIHEVSRWLGHKSIKTTVDIYGHLVPGAWHRCREISRTPCGRCRWTCRPRHRRRSTGARKRCRC